LWGSANKEHLHDVKAALNYLSEIRHITGRTAVGKETVKLTGINEILFKALNDIKTITEEDNR
jgi:hypothetical protein